MAYSCIFIGSIAVVVTLLPWNSANILKSPFVAVLEHIGIPAAAQIMNFIVLTAVLSCLNSGLYTNSRMLFQWQKEEMLKVILKLNSSGVPVRAVLFGTFFAYIGVVFSYISPDKVFCFSECIWRDCVTSLSRYCSFAFKDA